jgi:hypothetical protein
MSETIYGLCLPNDHYEHIVKLIGESKTNEIFLKDKAGVTHRFYKNEDNVFADKEESNGNILKHKVVTMSEAEKMVSKDKNKTNIEKRIKNDFPDMTKEEISVHTDILYEANESIKRLIENGMSKDLAVKLISFILQMEQDKKFSSAEELAEFIREISTDPTPIVDSQIEDDTTVQAVKNIIVSSHTLPSD